MTQQALRRNKSASQSQRSRKPVVRVLISVAGLVAGAAAVALWRGNDSDGNAATPFVGGDLHVVASYDGRLFVGGHQGAATTDSNGNWTQLNSLSNKDAMAWARSSKGILVGGHQGLYVSTDQGQNYEPAATNLQVTDVHALGASGETVYLASPQAGLFTSTDGGRTFTLVSDTGRGFMGSIAVDPRDPSHAIAPDMQAGAVVTTDGGKTWQALGGPSGGMAVAWNPRDLQDIVVIGMGGSARSHDGGKTWDNLTVPEGTSATAFSDQGDLVVAALDGDQASVYEQSGNTWTLHAPNTSP